MTYNAAHRMGSPTRWDRVRSWLADWLDRLCGTEWEHGLTDQEVAEDLPDYEPPERQVARAAYADGVYLDRRTLPPVAVAVTLWRPRVPPYVRLTWTPLELTA